MSNHHLNCMSKSRNIQSVSSSRLWNLLFGLISSDSTVLILEAWKLLRAIRAEREVGLYEVLDFEHTLELCDARGKKAIYHKREKVKLLQDHVSAYVDQVWGRGDIFADYRVSPGFMVDRYRDGNKYRVLISLREVKRRGEVFRISIDRAVRNAFNVKTDWSETLVRHRTRRFRIAMTFPRERPPKHVDLIQVNRGRMTRLSGTNTEIMSDGRHRVFWETGKPKLFETYTLKWAW